jgi:uncharacterized circularly permuted ATP-grasp superfamily protein
MIAADGFIRPHWARFLDGLEGMSDGELAKRWRLAERLLHENGLTYTADATTNADRPWDLDFVPVLIDADEWRMLEQGLIQRARLLNAILADLYGPQTLLRDGHLPAAVVLGNPQFLRPCHGFRPRGGLYLHVYAADLGRGPDGLWWVLADRTQAPSGVGFALENRIILSRCLPEMFRDLHVRRLANYFQSMHDSLVAGTDRGNPRVVLLTPGPGAEGYFAHAYLARYLGYTLVEGGDLTVRDDRVFLKSVDGLKPVDLILRRIEGEECDPLELRADSPLGVAGLTRAARAGNVVVADALGSGLAETKAMLPFPTPVPPTVLRGPATSEHADLVVRRRAGARLRSRQSRSALDRLRLQASLAAVENHQRRSRRRSFRARTTRRHRPDHDAQPRVRRPGAGAAVDDAGMDSGRPAAAADDAAGVSGGDQGRRLCRHARRPDPRLGVARCARRRAAPG